MASTIILFYVGIIFNLSFIKEAFRVLIEIARHAIDIWSIAYLYLNAIGIKLEKYNLDRLSEYFAFDRPTPHDAESLLRKYLELSIGGCFRKRCVLSLTPDGQS